jgi:hypothetical protein
MRIPAVISSLLILFCGFSSLKLVAQSKGRKQKEIRRLVKSVDSKLRFLKENDKAQFKVYISDGKIPKGKIGVIYSVVNDQLNTLKAEWPKAGKRYTWRTRRIVKTLAPEQAQ